MKNCHAVAIGLFAVALLLYLVGASGPMAGGFAFAGFAVEAMAWRRL